MGDYGPKSSVKAQNQKVEALRAGLIAIERAMGKSIKDLAAEYSISAAQVRRYLSSGEAEAMAEHYRALAYDRLAGKVMAVYEARLDLGDLEAARDLAFGLGILHKDPSKAQKDRVIETLDAYREERTKQHAAINERQGRTPALPPPSEGGGREVQRFDAEFPENGSHH